MLKLSRFFDFLIRVKGSVPNNIVDPNRLLESFTKISKLDEPIFHRYLEPQKLIVKGKKRNPKK
ncbi:hypothetical protein D3C85_1619190 [compost metagenome]